MSSPSATRPARTAPAVREETDYLTLADRFRPIFDRIRTGTVEREQNRVLPFEQIGWLKDAGFGALRVPTSHGGFGATIPQLFGLLTELSAADSNVTQALRGHFAFAEDRLVSVGGPERDVWLRRFAKGELAGNAWTEIGEVPIGEVLTKVSPGSDPGTFLVNGQKYYSTGSIFADWIDVYAQRTDTGEFVIAAVNAHEPGVTQFDDWDGFGQQTTGSGTSIYHDVPIPAENLIPFGTRFRYQTAFYQLFHLATLAGIARAATDEVSAKVAARTRIFSHGNASSYAADPQIQQVVGELSSAAFAAEAIARHAADDVQWAYETAVVGTAGDAADEDRSANIRAEISTGQGQVVSSKLVVAATAALFDALGASGVSKKSDLDRFWRNARTVASHNPWVFKAKVIGDYEINDTEPVYVWAIGAGAKK
jgi:alkylation response protein AidB-like acyl-CoA dehydrogenase